MIGTRCAEAPAGRRIESAKVCRRHARRTRNWKERTDGRSALALGERVPVIASHVGANPEMVKDNVNGLLLDVANIDAHVSDLAEVYKSGNTLRSRLVNDNFDISHLDPDRAVSAMLAWLQV